jgi:hypothetical protein
VRRRAGRIVGEQFAQDELRGADECVAVEVWTSTGLAV